MEVWQPHFLPELFDRLDQDIFGPLGQFAGLADFASDISLNLGRHRCFVKTRIEALVLIGERERAEEYLNELEQSGRHPPRWFDEQRTFLARDLESICAEYHAKEAAKAKALKLEGIWEPSPFPVELPAAERASRTNEKTFVTKPWIERPSWLLQEVPEKPGEICFAKDYFWRNGRVVLQVPLTRDGAEEMHRTRQNYVLTTRLANGNLLIFRHSTRWSPHDPVNAQNTYRPIDVFLDLYGALRLSAWCGESRAHRGFLHLHMINIDDDKEEYSSWQCSFLPKDETEKSIHDHRDGKRNYTRTEQTTEERDLINFAIPEFGDFTGLLARIYSIIETEGYENFA